MSIVATEEPRCLEPDRCDVVELIMQARPMRIGQFTVGRLLPTVKRRCVGPFVFLDLLGPAMVEPGAGMDIKPHPHIGLSTVTYLFAGEHMHRDSLGTAQLIRAGDLNIMTAGRGVVHSERMDAAQKARGGKFHGAQIWLGLPEVVQDCEPTFQHHPQATLPQIDPASGVRGRVLLGAAFGAHSPAVHESLPTLIELELDSGACVELPPGGPERAVLPVEGRLRLGAVEIEAERLAVLRPEVPALAIALAPTRLLFFGGPPLGHRFMDWNFVSSSQAKIEQAKKAWREQTFPKIPGDDKEFVPLPELPTSLHQKGAHS